MPEIIQHQIEKPETPLIKEISEKEIEISKEKIERLPDYQEAPAFYRGLPAEDALKAIFGQLKLESKPEKDPKKDIIGERDNAALSNRDAVTYAPTSIDKNGKKFLCAIGFDPAEKIEILPSCLGRLDQLRVNGKVKATEVIIRPAGKKPGQPSKVEFFSPKEFYCWYIKNIGLEK
jgi:hypothetical protein